MKKTINLMFALGIFVGVLSLLAENSFAQNKAAIKSDETLKPAKKSVWQNYIDISALSMGERVKAFNDLSAEDKASIFRFHLAYQIMKRPELNAEQREMIIESIANITPAIYEKDKDIELNEARVQDLRVRASAKFSRQEMFEIFASLGGGKEDIAILKKYRQVTLPVYETQRKGLFIALSPQDKSDVMRTHMIARLAEKSLTIEQIRITADSIVICTPDFYAKTGGNEKSGPPASVKAMSERINKAFEKKEAFEIFAHLGGECGGPSAEFGSCLCYTADDWCAWWGQHGSNCAASSPSNSCSPTSIGCGTYFWDGCNGLCMVSHSDKK